jgi:hypothetical protein
MKLSLSIAEKLLALQGGERIPLSKMTHPVVELMVDNGILKRQILGRSKTRIYLSDKTRLDTFLQNHFGMDSLENYIAVLQNEHTTRAEAVAVASDSKLKAVRTFKGFPVNCFQPLACMLNNAAFTLSPQEGAFVFIYDYESFLPPADVTIVGIENPENFRYIDKQKQLFEPLRPLFVSRYPQSKDLIRWLQAIPNRYLHFGDFDVAGLNIYCNEYKKHLSDRASFFLPPGMEALLVSKGNRTNYNKQTIQFDKDAIAEKNVLRLLALIEKYKKGLEQEALIPVSV